jgi:hypothetical protein
MSSLTVAGLKDVATHGVKPSDARTQRSDQFGGASLRLSQCIHACCQLSQRSIGPPLGLNQLSHGGIGLSLRLGQHIHPRRQFLDSGISPALGLSQCLHLHRQAVYARRKLLQTLLCACLGFSQL